MSQSTLINIQWTNRATNEIALPAHFLHRWGLKNNQSIFVRVGGRRVSATVKLLNTSAANHIQVSRSLKQKLLLPSINSLYIKYHNSHIQLGPVVGIAYGQITRHAVRMLQHLSQHGAVVIAFLPSEVNWKLGMIHGRTLSRTPSGRWRMIKQLLPLPDVIYNRVVPHTAYQTLPLQRFVQQVRTRRMPFFNPPFFFRKDDIQRFLVSDASIKNHLPETIIGPTLEEVSKMLSRHKSIFFKPLLGSQGKGIYKISGDEQSGYVKQSRFNKQYKVSSSKTLVPLYHEIMAGDGRSKYLVQQGVHLAQLQGNFFDFRVHLFKDSRHRWQVGALGANVFGSDKITTHGGWVKPAQDVLVPVFGTKAKRIEADIHQLCVRVANTVSRSYKLPIGEIAMDIGVDQSGKVWFFEANSKPGLHIFKHWKIKGDLNRSMGILAGYCRTLAGF